MIFHKPCEKAYKLADEKGLFLLVAPNGSKYWRLKYRFAAKEKMLAFGVYPEITLAEARERRDEARKLLANNVDPAMVKQLSKQAEKQASMNSFEAITREWFAKYSVQWTPDYNKRLIRRIERDIFPWLGHRSISEISAPELLNEEAEKIDAIIAVMMQYKRQMAETLCKYYLKTEPTIEVSAKVMGISVAQFKIEVGKAIEWLAGWLSAQNIHAA